MTGQLVREDPGVGERGSVSYADGRLYCCSEDGTVGLPRPSPEECEIVGSFRGAQRDGSR